jgi:hypothetical protein
MATATIDDVSETVGPIQGAAGILAMTGTCTAGGVILMVRPQGGDTYYPAGYITAAMIQQVPNEAGDGYGFVHGFHIPGGGHAKGVSSSDFTGDLSAEILPAAPEMVSGLGLGVLGDSAAVPVAQSADVDLTALAARATSATVAVAASATTDGMDITVTMKDQGGTTVTGVQNFVLFMSEDSAGADLTADDYTDGSMTASVGAVLATLTSKKCWLCQTADTGIFTGTLVSSENPADQYACVQLELGGAVIPSAVSGANWEGAS